jgi:Flp pilus assembly pilin Flp
MRNMIASAGQSTAEYALIVAVIVLVALLVLALFQQQIADVLSAIAERIN